MKIAVLGLGQVGNGLGMRLVLAGHRVCFGVRDPHRPETLQAASAAGATVASLQDATRSAEVVLLAVPWSAAESVIRALDLRGKILVDVTNAYRIDGDGVSGTASPSGIEQMVAWAPGAKLVKAFNQTGFNNLANPDYGLVRPVMFACGSDVDAVAIVLTLAADIGFDAVNAGDLRGARHLDNLALLWIHLAYLADQGREIAFSLMKR